MGIILNTCTDPGYTRAVWVIEPTYYLACRIIDDAGLKARRVEDGVNGIDFVQFRKDLEEVEKEAIRLGKTGPVSCFSQSRETFEKRSYGKPDMYLWTTHKRNRFTSQCHEH
jgi:hypothetical protein